MTQTQHLSSLRQEADRVDLKDTRRTWWQLPGYGPAPDRWWYHSQSLGEQTMGGQQGRETHSVLSATRFTNLSTST